jgi:hypothetical protein
LSVRKLLVFFFHPEDWTEGLMQSRQVLTTWATTPVLSFVFCSWNRVSLTLSGLASNWRSFYLCLPISWDNRCGPPYCFYLFKYYFFISLQVYQLDACQVLYIPAFFTLLSHFRCIVQLTKFLVLSQLNLLFSVFISTTCYPFSCSEVRFLHSEGVCYSLILVFLL